MRAIDVWVIFCYIGMFSAIMEYCLILYLKKAGTIEQNVKNQVYIANHHSEEIQTLKENGAPKQNENLRVRLANVIEKIAMILLPTYSIVFPIIYFMICTLDY